MNRAWGTVGLGGASSDSFYCIVLDPIRLGPGPCVDGVVFATLSFYLGTKDLQEFRVEIMSLNLRALPSWDLLLS